LATLKFNLAVGRRGDSRGTFGADWIAAAGPRGRGAPTYVLTELGGFAIFPLRRGPGPKRSMMVGEGEGTHWVEAAAWRGTAGSRIQLGSFSQ